MNKYPIIALALLALALTCTGCAQPELMTPSQPVTLQTTDKALTMKAAERVLRNMQFVIEKYDVEKGLITTKPLSGAQFFEFWRADNASSFAYGEANLHSIRRTVALNLSQNASDISLDCDVNVTRLSIPEMKVAGMAHAASMYTDSDSSLQKLVLNAEQAEDMAWIELGPDPDLEMVIMQRIKQKLTQLEAKK